MSPIRESLLPRVLRATLDHYRRRRRLVAATRGLFLAAGFAAGGVGVAISIDRLARSSPSLRMVFLGAIGAAVLFAFGRWIAWPALRRMTDREAAVRLGRRFPRAEEDLISAVELSRLGERPEAGVSPALVYSALGNIAGRTRTVDYRAAVPLRPLIETAFVFLLIAGVLQGAYLLQPEAIRNALARLFQPRAGVPFFSYVKLQVQPGDRVVATGDTVDVNVHIGGRTVDEARLEAATGADRLAVALPCPNRAAHWRSGALFHDLTYRVVAGDAQSDWYRVRVVPPPSLSGKSAVVRAPAYAGEQETVIDPVAGPVEMVVGSTVILGATPTARGNEARFRCRGELVAGDGTVALAADETGRLRSPSLQPAAAVEYAVHLVDGFGLENRAPEGFFLKVAPDRLPRVRLPQPGRDLVLLAHEAVAVEALADDDLGLRGLTLRHRVAAAKAPADAAPAWKDEDLAAGGPTLRELRGRHTFTMTGLVPGDVIEYQAIAADFADEAHVRRAESPLFRIVLMSNKEHLERTLAALRDLQVELLRAAAAQKVEAEKAGALAKEAGKQPVNEQARQGQQREIEQARATENTARKMEDLMAELGRNPSTPQGLFADLNRLSRGVRGVAQGEMSEAARQLGQASQSQGQEQAGAMQQAQQSQTQAARRLQQLADDAERMQRRSLLERLAIEAERLARVQRDVGDDGLRLGKETVGLAPEDLPAPKADALKDIVKRQTSVRDDVKELVDEIAAAADILINDNPVDAAKAVAAGGKLEDDRVAPTTAEIVPRLEKNALLSQVPRQAAAADSLDAAAKLLRGADKPESLEAIAKEIENFLRRQKEINSHIEAGIAERPEAPEPQALSTIQLTLERDVKEQAAALRWLAEELPFFRSATADKLGAAAGEMHAGAAALLRPDLPQGLEHGKRALALLEDAREKFQQERQQMQQAQQAQIDMKAMLLFWRVLSEQRRVNDETAAGDRARIAAADFTGPAADLARHQQSVREDAAKLQEMLAGMRGAAALLDLIGAKMDVSHVALGAADTSRETRVLQRQIIALLERFMQDAPQNMGAGGAQAMAMMQQMMMAAGRAGGGFRGGHNAAVDPTRVTRADDETWRRARSRFEEELGAAFEGRYPPEFRDLLDAYFERLRKEK